MQLCIALDANRSPFYFRIATPNKQKRESIISVFVYKLRSGYHKSDGYAVLFFLGPENSQSR